MKNEINSLQSYEIDLNEATPMLKQFLEIKRKNNDVILLYRMGDFYETFFEDAITASKELEITLTSREGGNLGRVPMAGVPVKAVDNYISKLIEKNYKVAICEQLEDPALTKGLVKRDIVRTITAGTLTETNLLQSDKNNYLAAIIQTKNKDLYGLAYTDISTGEFKITQANLTQLLSELSRIKPSEIIAPAKTQKLMPWQVVAEEIIELPSEITNYYSCTKISAAAFDETNAISNIKTVFKTNSLKSFGYPDFTTGIMAAGAIIEYIFTTQKENIPKFDVIKPYALEKYLIMDASTRKNLELTETVRDKARRGSLLWAIDKTCTNMGARMLRKWIQQPLKDIEEIKSRQDTVEELISDNKLRLELSSLLDKVHDIERLATKISNNSANARDYLSIKQSLQLIPEFSRLLATTKSQYLEYLKKDNTDLLQLCQVIEKSINEDPPIGIKEGNIIKAGVSEELDYLRNLLTGGREWLENFERQEKERTNIKSLKVGFSKSFGYFIEVTHSNTNLVPANYVRKQTLTNAERYITEELRKHESEVLTAQSKSIEMEYKIFCDFREYSKEYVEKIRELANAFAKLDTLLSLANVATEHNFTKPQVDDSEDLIIIDGRHPVIEQILPMGQYVANNLSIKANSADSTDTQFMILTGPNMAGKSTYMRQNALIAILAQIGSFVPAKSAKIGIIDKIFTRVGAVDDLSLGQSTFMVEMSETALILNSATQKSLILLDEIGRGTSTYDGVAIAWSVAEHIATKIKARSIFATHYHELNVMSHNFPQIKNFRITISEQDGNIEFLRQVVEGGTSKSYGIQVAKMAGLPSSVISRAQNLMNKMQKNYATKISTGKKQEVPEVNEPQLSLFME